MVLPPCPRSPIRLFHTRFVLLLDLKTYRAGVLEMQLLFATMDPPTSYQSTSGLVLIEVFRNAMEKLFDL